MSAHLPRRDDDVAVWLLQNRETWNTGSQEWCVIDELLDEYRLHADTGTPLLEHACAGPDCWCQEI